MNRRVRLRRFETTHRFQTNGVCATTVPWLRGMFSKPLFVDLARKIWLYEEFTVDNKKTVTSRSGAAAAWDSAASASTATSPPDAVARSAINAGGRNRLFDGTHQNVPRIRYHEQL